MSIITEVGGVGTENTVQYYTWEVTDDSVPCEFKAPPCQADAEWVRRFLPCRHHILLCDHHLRWNNQEAARQPMACQICFEEALSYLNTRL